MQHVTTSFINGRIFTSAHDRGAPEAIISRDGREAWVGARTDAPQSIHWSNLQGPTAAALCDTRMLLTTVRGVIYLDARCGPADLLASRVE